MKALTLQNLLIKVIILFGFIFTSFVCSPKQEGTNNGNNTPEGNNTKEVKETQNPDKKASSTDNIIIKTSDSKELSASYYYEQGKKDNSQPLVILVHQFKQNKEQWKIDFIDSLVVAGFKVLTYDIRGHGKSSNVEYDLTKILEDPDEAPNDIKAVFAWAKNEKGIDTARIGVMGTSIGGNLACYAALNLNAKVIVSVSNGKETFERFTGYDERMMGRPYFPKFKNALFICGSKDGDHEQGIRWIADNFLEPPKEIKVYDSDKHGKALIDEFPEINELSINWFKKYL
ncbi:MAG TPA: alpha/beta fold hydrolase [Ignavibacteria bacterium]|jgi:pimeloyl-ACP methyl ester carboxylesterase